MVPIPVLVKKGLVARTVRPPKICRLKTQFISLMSYSELRVLCLYTDLLSLIDFQGHFIHFHFIQWDRRRKDYPEPGNIS